MSKYHKRVITYDSHTQNYKISIPELGIEFLADTESSGLIQARKEIEDYCINQSKALKSAKDEENLFGFFGEYEE